MCDRDVVGKALCNPRSIPIVRSSIPLVGSVSGTDRLKGDGSYEAIPFAGDGLDETRLFGIVAEDLPDFADGFVDAVLGIEEDVLAPDSVNDLFARDETTVALHQKGEELHRNFLEFEDALASSKLVAVLVQFELSKLDNCVGHSRGYSKGKE